jgi:hypothetical protein
LAVALSLLAVLVSIGRLSAAPIVAVDFDQNDPNFSNNSVTQSGFTSVSGPVQDNSTPTASQAIAPYTVTVTASPVQNNFQGFFYRGGLTNSGSFTDANLYNDFVYTNGSAGSTIQLSISGVTPGKEYALTLYSYDHTLNSVSSETNTFAPTGNTTGGTGTVTYAVDPSTPNTVDAPTYNSEFSTTIYVSSTTNTLDILASANNQGDGSDGLRINGFTLSDVPEPGSLAALAGLGAMGLIALAKRRCS